MNTIYLPKLGHRYAALLALFALSACNEPKNLSGVFVTPEPKASPAPITIQAPGEPADEQAPSVPSGVLAIALSQTSVQVSWNASTDNRGVSRYRLFRDGIEIAGSITGVLYNDLNLSANTNYSYTVAAQDGAGNISANSSPVTARTLASPDTQNPSIPAGLTGIAASQSQINLTWTASTDNVGVTGYKIYRNSVLVGSVAGTSFSDTGLSAATSYSYEVTAFDAAGNVSNKTALISVVTTAGPDTQAPTVPAGVSGSVISSTQINISWSGSTDNIGVTGYRIYRNNVQVGSLAGNSFSDTGLTAATTYSYAVAAFDGAGNTSAKSTAISVTTSSPPDVVAPTVPTGLSGSVISSTQINVTWNVSTDAVGVTGYKVYRNNVLVASVAGNSFSDTGLVASTAYSYAVTAFDLAGNASAKSAAISVTTSAAPDTQAPTVPAGVSGSVISSTQINISWSGSTDNIGVTGYRIYRNNVQVGSLAGNSFSDTGLTAATTYSYAVAAFDGAGNTSAKSTAISVTTSPAPDTQAPTVPAGLTGSAVSPFQIDLTWTASTDNIGVTGYKVFRNGSEVATNSTNSFSNTGLAALTNYNFTVAAYDAAGNLSAQSLAASIATPSASASVTLAPIADAYIGGTAIHSTEEWLHTYTWPDETIANAIVMKFDVSSIPTSAVIDNAELTLYLLQSEPDSTTSLASSTYNVSVHKMIGKDMDVNTATAVKYNATGFWTPNSGAPIGLEALGQNDISTAYITNIINKTNGPKYFPITQMVQEWVAPGAINYGMLLNSDPTSVRDHYRYFGAIENATATYRPFLKVDYHLPAP